MARVAVVDTGTNKVVNIAAMEEGSDWAPPEGCIAVPNEHAAIGMTYQDGIFSGGEPEAETV